MEENRNEGRWRGRPRNGEELGNGGENCRDTPWFLLAVARDSAAVWALLPTVFTEHIGRLLVSEKWFRQCHPKEPRAKCSEDEHFRASQLSQPCLYIWAGTTANTMRQESPYINIYITAQSIDDGYRTRMMVSSVILTAVCLFTLFSFVHNNASAQIRNHIEIHLHHAMNVFLSKKSGSEKSTVK